MKRVPMKRCQSGRMRTKVFSRTKKSSSTLRYARQSTSVPGQPVGAVTAPSCGYTISTRPIDSRLFRALGRRMNSLARKMPANSVAPTLAENNSSASLV
ncbi:hypothetical protein D3C76_1135590 [compost metagenome]